MTAGARKIRAMSDMWASVLDEHDTPLDERRYPVADGQAVLPIKVGSTVKAEWCAVYDQPEGGSQLFRVRVPDHGFGDDWQGTLPFVLAVAGH